MKTKLMMMAAFAAIGMTIVSCSSDNDSLVEDVKPGKAHVRLVCGMGVSVSPMRVPMTRAVLSANDKELTDLYILDYDKSTGKLLQVLHQTSTAADFAEPDLTLDYGEHVLKVVATRSQEPTLWDAQKTTWQVEPNILTPITATQPVMLTSTKTSDTFGAEKEVSVGIGTAATVNIALDRLVAKLVINSTDVFPDDCTTITLDFREYHALSWATMDVTDAVDNQRIVDVASQRGAEPARHYGNIAQLLCAGSQGWLSDGHHIDNEPHRGQPLLYCHRAGRDAGEKQGDNDQRTYIRTRAGVSGDCQRYVGQRRPRH